MLRRITLGCMMMLVCLPVPNQAGPQQESPRPIRILVEGEGSVPRSIIEALRRASANYNIKLEFVSGSGDPYDLRLFVRSGVGSREVPCYCEDEDSSIHYESYYFTSADALTADGKLLFEVKGNGGTPGISALIIAYESLAREVFKNIDHHVESLRKESISNDRVSQETINQIEPKEAVNARTEEIPKEPGVYYKDGTNWILLRESLTKMKTRGIVKAILTIWLSSTRGYDVYNGASSKLQLPEQKPEFYIRTYPISEENIAIVRLKKEKDRREVQSSSLSLRKYSGIKAKDIHRIKVTRISDDFYKLVPDAELQSGEYALDLDLSTPTIGGYEFGIR
jgi:hypothetical protein